MNRTPHPAHAALSHPNRTNTHAHGRQRGPLDDSLEQFLAKFPPRETAATDDVDAVGRDERHALLDGEIGGVL